MVKQNQNYVSIYIKKQYNSTKTRWHNSIKFQYKLPVLKYSSINPSQIQA